MQGSHYRAIFISDVHLGTHACQAEYLLDFLENNTADTLYLVGDIIDLMAMRKRVNFTAAHESVIAHVAKRARSGQRVIYIPGNHDAFFRKFVGQTFAGIEIHRDAVYTSLSGKRFFVSHGDEFDGVMRCSQWLTRFGDFSHGVLLRIHTLVNSIRKSRRLPYWSLARAVKERIGKAQNFITQFEKIGSLSAKEHQYDGYICGHIHHWQLAYHHDDVLYMNDGDWVEHCSALVETMQGEFELLHWSDHTKVLMSTATVKPAVPEPETESEPEPLYTGKPSITA